MRYGGGSWPAGQAYTCRVRRWSIGRPAARFGVDRHPTTRQRPSSHAMQSARCPDRELVVINRSARARWPRHEWAGWLAGVWSRSIGRSPSSSEHHATHRPSLLRRRQRSRTSSCPRAGDMHVQSSEARVI